MELTPPQRQLLTSCAREVVAALDEIARCAREKLDQASPVSPQNVVALPINPMTTRTSPGVSRIGQALREDRQALSRLAREPFVARVVVSNDDTPTTKTTFYISRGPVAGMELPSARLANYGAALGRLAELRPGSSYTLRSASGTLQQVTVEERVRLQPVPTAGAWDATDSSFEMVDWQVVLASLKRLLEQDGLQLDLDDATLPDLLGSLLQQGLESQLLREKARRTLIESISLRDQPILDAFQGAVFRLPLDRKVLLLGPPGTGKTTTLIRRLAHKRTIETLAEEEKDLLTRRGLAEAFFLPQSWAMFAPTELLKLYLREAFNREGVPATDDNLRTWSQERLTLARNVLGILRSTERQGFQFDANATPLAADDSTAGTRLFDRFDAYLREWVANRMSDALDGLQQAGDPQIWGRVSRVFPAPATEPSLARRLSRVLERGETLQPDLKKLDEEIDSEVRRVGNRLVHQNPSLLDELVDALAQWAQEGGDEPTTDQEDEDTDEAGPVGDSKSSGPTTAQAAQALLGALRVYARGVARGRPAVRGRAGKVVALLGARVPAGETVTHLGSLLVTRQQLRSVVQAPRLFVMSVPRVYAQFRREFADDRSLFGPTIVDQIKAGRISGAEVDVMILTMMRNTRLLLQPESLRGNLAPSGSHGWLEAIRSQYVCQVLVDEATDFSAIQLGCLIELTHPSLRCWFACGDFMQRVTRHGVTALSDVSWLERLDGEPVVVESVSIGYRQSDKLRGLAEALTRTLTADVVRIEAPEHEHPNGVAPILVEHHDGIALADWLAHRIVDIESRLGVLPSIAIFVDGDNRIDPLVNDLRPFLAERNLAVVGCKEGRVVGDDREVRVFDVRYIKGLEFEAVFFVGVDRLAESLGSLFDHLFYVGASRAATYLGVTSEGPLPRVLTAVRDHFGEGTWDA